MDRKRIILSVEIEENLREQMQLARAMHDLNWSSYIRRSIMRHLDEMENSPAKTTARARAGAAARTTQEH